MMKLKSILIASAVGLATTGAFANATKTNEVNGVANASTGFVAADVQQKADALFDSLKLSQIGLERDVFSKAYRGYTYLMYKGLVNNPAILSIADFSQSSKNKRLYVINLVERKVVFNTFVSHGKNSGYEMATSFSNFPDSYKSTVGFMLTDDTYNGHCGYSLRFNGMEPGINDQIRNRAIIVHGSNYVNEMKADEEGRVGNSLGCPAVPKAECQKIIDYIKGGTVYFIYSPNENYNASSPILNGTLIVPQLLLNQGSLPSNVAGPVL